MSAISKSEAVWRLKAISDKVRDALQEARINCWHRAYDIATEAEALIVALVPHLAEAADESDTPVVGGFGYRGSHNSPPSPSVPFHPPSSSSFVDKMPPAPQHTKQYAKSQAKKPPEPLERSSSAPPEPLRPPMNPNVGSLPYGQPPGQQQARRTIITPPPPIAIVTPPPAPIARPKPTAPMPTPIPVPTTIEEKVIAFDFLKILGMERVHHFVMAGQKIAEPTDEEHELTDIFQHLPKDAQTQIEELWAATHMPVNALIRTTTRAYILATAELLLIEGTK